MTSTPTVLRAYLVAQRRDLEADLPAPHDVESVHRIRTRARRIRSVLAAFENHTPDAAGLSTDLRRLGRTVGRLRDLDVIRQRLDHLDLVSGLLDHERTALLDDVRAALDRPRTARLSGGLAALVAAEAWAGLPPDPIAEVAQRVLCAERERVLRRERVAAGAQEDRPRRLHDVRKAAKRLRYAAEAAGPAYQTLASRAQTLQDLLGRSNDALQAAAWLDRAARAHPDLAARPRHRGRPAMDGRPRRPRAVRRGRRCPARRPPVSRPHHPRTRPLSRSVTMGWTSNPTGR